MPTPRHRHARPVRRVRWTRRRSPLPRLLALAVAALALELLARVTTAALEGRHELSFLPVAERLGEIGGRARELLGGDPEALVEPDPELGWIHAAGHRGAIASTNARGLRGRREYGPEPRGGRLRIAAFGSCAVHGCEVADAEGWTARAEAAERRLELLNYGVTGYGIDQSLLLFRRHGAELRPDLVVLAFSGADYPRGVSRFGPFRDAGEPPLGKPRFALAPDGGLELLPNPLPGRDALRRLGERPELAFEAAPGDRHFEPWVWRNPLHPHSAAVRLASGVAARAWRGALDLGRPMRAGLMNPRSEAFAVLAASVRSFAEEVQQQGRRFLLVTFPDARDLFRRPVPAYAPLLAAVSDLDVLDLAPALRADPELTRVELETPGRYYSAGAHAAVAEALREGLAARGLLPGGGVPTLAARPLP